MTNNSNGFNKVERSVVANNLVPELTQSSSNVLTSFDKRAEYQCLDATGRDRFSRISHFYDDDDCFKILDRIESYGINTFNSVKGKIDFIASGGHDNEYFSAILNSIQIGTLYKTVDISRYIGSLRKSMGFPPYLSNIDKSCARDFLIVFMAEVSLSDWNDVKTQKPFPIGYTPTLNLNCQR